MAAMNLIYAGRLFLLDPLLKTVLAWNGFLLTHYPTLFISFNLAILLAEPQICMRFSRPKGKQVCLGIQPFLIGNFFWAWPKKQIDQVTHRAHRIFLVFTPPYINSFQGSQTVQKILDNLDKISRKSSSLHTQCNALFIYFPCFLKLLQIQNESFSLSLSRQTNSTLCKKHMNPLFTFIQMQFWLLKLV